eukprot:c27704_g1_i1 orf=137-1981(+)
MQTLLSTLDLRSFRTVGATPLDPWPSTSVHIKPCWVLPRQLGFQGYGSSQGRTVAISGQIVSDLRRDLDQLGSSNTVESVLQAVCNLADSFISGALDPPNLEPSNDPRVQLAGNFAPVEETPPQQCLEVKGILPADLNGIYIRNGPNAGMIYGNGGHHIFDGNGMLHGVRIRDKIATYCCRHVRTSRFMQEQAAGRALFPRFFGGISGASGLARIAMHFVRGALGILDITKGSGLSNTNVAYFNGKVLSLSEEDMPYVVKVTEEGDLETGEKLNLGDSILNMCAHPKFNPTTGEMFAFNFNPTNLPPFTYFRVSADGVKAPGVPVPIFDLPLMHDFAITNKYAIFPDNQFVLRPLRFFRGEFPVVYEKNKTARLGILPRYSTPQQALETRWFDVPGFNCFHYLNAWDEEDEVVLIGFVLSPPEFFLEIPVHRMCSSLTEIRLNMKTGMSSQTKLCPGSFELATYNHGYTGRKIKYAYMLRGYFPDFSEVVKIDLELAKSETQKKAGISSNPDVALSEHCIVARRDFGKGCNGSEPFFVPRSTSNGNNAEDAGYLLSLVHSELTGISALLIMDAESPSLDPVASIKIPARVPYGFHGCFVSDAQLSRQARGRGDS